MPVSSKPRVEPGVLYIVATPIGNLGDISRRAIEVLQQVDSIAAEDTRHSRKLLAHFGITTPLSSLHDHNERAVSARLLERLRAGESIALISDAGTPLISDPGFYLVREARAAGFRVVPVPGASALISALSVAGLPTDRFVFEGFLPPRQAARLARLKALRSEPRTLVFYESGHRILACLEDMQAVFGPEREAVIARELTKAFETVRAGSLAQLAHWVAADTDQQRGEFVLVVKGGEAPAGDTLTPDAERLLALLLEELPLKQATKLAARITGINKRLLYDLAVTLKHKP